MAHLAAGLVIQRILEAIGVRDRAKAPVTSSAIATEPTIQTTSWSGDGRPRFVDGPIGDVSAPRAVKPPDVLGFGLGIHPANREEDEAQRQIAKYNYYSGVYENKSKRLKEMLRNRNSFSAEAIRQKEQEVDRYRRKVNHWNPNRVRPQYPVSRPQGGIPSHTVGGAGPAGVAAPWDSSGNNAFGLSDYNTAGVPHHRKHRAANTAPPGRGHRDLQPSDSSCLVNIFTADQMAIARELDQLVQSDVSRPHKRMELMSEGQPDVQAKVDVVMQQKFWPAVGDVPAAAHRAAQLVHGMFSPDIVDWIGKARQKLDKSEFSRLRAVSSLSLPLAAAYVQSNDWATFCSHYGSSGASAGKVHFEPPAEGFFALAWILDHVSPTMHSRTRAALVFQEEYEPIEGGQQIMHVLRWLEWLGDKICVQLMFSHLGVQTRGGMGLFCLYRTPAEDQGPQNGNRGIHYWDRKLFLYMWYGMGEGDFSVDEQAQPFSDAQTTAERDSLDRWPRTTAITLDSVLELSRIGRIELERLAGQLGIEQLVGLNKVAFAPSMNPIHADKYWKTDNTPQVVSSSLRAQALQVSPQSFARMRGLFRGHNAAGSREHQIYDQAISYFQGMIEELSTGLLDAQLLDQCRYGWTPVGSAPVRLTHLEIRFALEALKDTLVHDIDFGNYVPLASDSDTGGESIMDLTSYRSLLKIMIPVPGQNQPCVRLNTISAYPPGFDSSHMISLAIFDLVLGPLNAYVESRPLKICFETGNDTGVQALKRDFKHALEYKYAVSTAAHRAVNSLTGDAVRQAFDHVKSVYIYLKDWLVIYKSDEHADSKTIDAVRTGYGFQIDLTTLFNIDKKTDFDGLRSSELVQRLKVNKMYA